MPWRWALSCRGDGRSRALAWPRARCACIHIRCRPIGQSCSATSVSRDSGRRQGPLACRGAKRGETLMGKDARGDTLPRRGARVDMPTRRDAGAEETLVRGAPTRKDAAADRLTRKRHRRGKDAGQRSAGTEGRSRGQADAERRRTGGRQPERVLARKGAHADRPTRKRRWAEERWHGETLAR